MQGAVYVCRTDGPRALDPTRMRDADVVLLVRSNGDVTIAKEREQDTVVVQGSRGMEHPRAWSGARR